MSDARYLPAVHARVHDLPLGRLSVRTSDDREVGRLLGFVIDPGRRHISALVMEVNANGGSQQVASPLVPLRFDEEARAFVLVGPDVPRWRAFDPDGVASLDEQDLWVPLIHTAA
jgi:hypothetical protein